ncbi:hypothetical protein lerEdw1_018105 [Lerista edwardsae]|nr:hypothetical protein lerEdw1_018105 [Lerista edwardsae]
MRLFLATLKLYYSAALKHEIIFIFLVPPPTNVVITSNNFNTSLQWDYRNVSVDPLFTVEITCYSGGTKYVVDTCENISLRYCDLTHKISTKCAKHFWAKVKAVLGLNESSYIVSERYDVFEKGHIGPPKLRLSLENDGILVVIDDPLTPYFEENNQLSVRENISDFSYNVLMWPRGNNRTTWAFRVTNELCGKRSCNKSLPVQIPDIEYCVSAQGISEEELITGEESNESCITPSKHSLDLTGPIIAGIIATVVIAVILAISIVYLCSKRPNVKLPKSLATVVRSIKPSEIKPESKCNVSIYKPVKPQCEDEDLTEHTDPIEELKPTDLNCWDKDVNTDDSQRASSKAGDIGLQDGTVVEIPESEHSLEANDNYSKSVSGQEEPCDLLPSLDLPRADARQPTNIGICRNISGYDKPHWRDSNPDGEAALVV